MDYLLHILILIGIYIILSASLNLIVGYTGLFSIAHAAFFGVGAYCAALMALKMSTPFPVNLICAIAFCGILGALVGIPSLRIHDDYFVLSTFSFQVITLSLLNNLIGFTGGPMGLPDIPLPTIFGLKISSHPGFLILTIFSSGIILYICKLIVQSPFGRVLKSIREDEIFTQSVGKNVSAYKILIFIIGAGMASIAGVIYAYYISFIDPSSFTVMESIFILTIVIIGGTGSLLGPVAGAVILVVLPEVFRFIGLPDSIAANLRQILYGGLLVIFMIWRPTGLLGEFTSERKGINE